MAVSIYLSYKALLRMCELVCITYGDFVIAEDCQSFILALYEGKTVTLHGRIENVKVSDPSLTALLSLIKAERAKGDKWIRFCKRFNFKTSSSRLTACAVEAPLTTSACTEIFTRPP